jgi:hypothetical protein
MPLLSVDEAVKRVKELTKSDDLFTAIFRNLMNRRYINERIDVYRMRLDLNKTGLGLTHLVVHQAFEKLESAGLGKLTFKPLPEHSSFLFALAPKEVLERVFGAEATLARIKNKRGDLPARRKTDTGFQVFVPFRDGVLPISFPTPPTEDEIDAIAAYLRGVARSMS